MTSVKLCCFLLIIALALVYIADAKGVLTGNIVTVRLSRTRTGSTTRTRWQQLKSIHDQATQRPLQHSSNWKPTHAGDNQHPVTPDPIDDTNTGRPIYGGSNGRVRPTPYQTDDTSSEEAIYGGNHHRVTPYPTDSATTGRQKYGGSHHHVTSRPNHHQTPSSSEETSPAPTNSFQAQLQRYLRKVTIQRQLSAAAPEKKTKDIRTPRFSRGLSSSRTSSSFSRNSFGSRSRTSSSIVRPTSSSIHRTIPTIRPIPTSGGHRHSVTPRPTVEELTSPLPTNSFKTQLQRYLRKLEQQRRQLSAAAPQKKSNDFQTQTHQVQCPHHRVPCRNTGVCIDTEWLCDDENDCFDWSDEEHC